MAAAEIIKAMEDAEGCTVFGIRSIDERLSVGDDVPDSHDWNYELDQPSEDTLDGACATGFGQLWDGEENADKNAEIIESAVKENARYGGAYQYLIGGRYFEYGNDEGEIIIQDAVVIAIVK